MVCVDVAQARGIVRRPLDPRTRRPSDAPSNNRLQATLGVLGGGVGLVMHVYTLWCFVGGVRVPDQALHYLGIAVGLAWSFAYLRAARRWKSSPRGSSHAGDRASTEPIEPS